MFIYSTLIFAPAAPIPINIYILKLILIRLFNLLSVRLKKPCHPGWIIKSMISIRTVGRLIVTLLLSFVIQLFIIPPTYISSPCL